MKMQLIFILSSLIIVQAGVIKESDCDGVFINGVYHEKEVLKTDLDRPYLLAIDYSTNTLYFSYSVSKEDDVFKTASLNINTKEFKDIDGVTNGFAQAVDQNTHEVYIGSSEGIYKYDHDTNKAVFYGEKDANIWTLYFKDVLYYSDYPQQFLYTYKDGASTKFKDLEDTKVDQFLIDDDDYMYFSNATGLYSQKKGTKDAVLYKELSVGVRGLTTNTKGTVHVCLQDGVYAVNKTSVSLDKVIEIEDAFGLAFDNTNHIVYSDATSLVRLEPNKDKTCQTQN